MGKKYKNLFSLITDKDNLRSAYRKASKGKRTTSGYLNFKEYEALNLKLIRDELINGEYVQGEYRVFQIYEPKKRTISALPFRDRIVQHAICNVITPIFETTMLPTSYACRDGKGTHAGAKKCQSYIRQVAKNNQDCYILKTDFSGYFYNICQKILLRLIRAKISCKKTLSVLYKVLPFNSKGIPIGNLTSQLFANIFGNAVDRFLSQELRVNRWVRYMDDIVIVSHSMSHLKYVERELKRWCSVEMNMEFSKSYIKNYKDGIDFLGYRIFEKYKLIRKDSVTRARRKIKRYVNAKDSVSLGKFLSSFHGHIKHADSHNLTITLINYQRKLLCLQNKSTQHYA